MEVNGELSLMRNVSSSRKNGRKLPKWLKRVKELLLMRRSVRSRNVSVITWLTNYWI